MKIKLLIRILKKISLLGLLVLALPLWGQGGIFPVQIIPQVTPPPPIYLSNYADASTINSPLRVQLILNDFNIQSRAVRLKTYFQGSGLNFQSTDLVTGATPLFLEAGVPLILTNTELAPYFRFENIAGISPNVYGNAIPEGTYQFCFEVFDVATGNRLSSKTCVTTVIFKNEPPFLVTPRNRSNVAEINPQYIVFQWTPRSINVSNVEYELSLVEIWDTQIDPQAAFLSSPPIYQTTTNATTYVYGPSDPLLLSGKNYAWRIQAKAKQGTEEIGLFKNEGYSEIYSFSYATACDLPEGINHQVKGSTIANIFWEDFSNDVPEYTIRYRKAPSNSPEGGEQEWFYNKTTSNTTSLWGLAAGTRYEYQIQKKCAVTKSDWSIAKQFTTHIADNEASVYECGITPDFSLSNTEKLASLTKGDTFKAGDFPVKVLSTSGSNGRFTGTGYVTIPYLNSIRVSVQFTNVLINTDKQLAEGTVVTYYDENLSNILDLDEAIETVGNIGEAVGELFEGNNDLDEIRINWVLDPEKDIEIKDGILVITNPANGATETSPLGDDKVIVDAAGNVYHVDAGGNVTKGGQIDPSGSVTTGNITGVSKQGELEALTAEGIQVRFEDQGTYGFDKIPSTANDQLKKEYTTIPDVTGKEYTLAHIAVEKGNSISVTAKVDLVANSAYRLADLKFKTKAGELIPAKINERTNTIDLSIKGYYTLESETIYAVVNSKQDSTQQLTAGAFTLWHLTDRTVNVVLVSVDGAPLPNSTTIENIFKKGIVSLTIETAAAELDDSTLGLDKRLEIGDSPWLTAYNAEQKEVITHLKSQIDYDKSKYYVFVFPKSFETTKPIAGFMPLQRQFGFVFSADLNAGEESKNSLEGVTAHELGHGIFALQHPFTQYGTTEGSTNWLMDYGEGIKLPHTHWAQMHNPALKFYVFQDEEDGEIGKKIWFTPDWEPFTVGTSHTILTIKSEHVNGTVWGFQLEDKEKTQYKATLRSDGKYEYIIYPNDNSSALPIYPIEKVQLKENAIIYLFDSSSECNKRWETKYKKGLTGFENYALHASKPYEYPCENCDKGQEFIAKYKEINDPKIQGVIIEISKLICAPNADPSFIDELEKRGISNMFGWQQMDYYDGFGDISLEAFKKFKKVYELYIAYFNAAKEIVKTSEDRKAIIQIAYNLSESQLTLLTVPERLVMLRLMATGPMLGYWTSSDYNVEALALKIIRSISFEESDEFINGLVDQTYSIDNQVLYKVLFKRIDDALEGENFTQLILYLTDLTLQRHNIDKSAANSISVIEEKAQGRFVWDVQNESFLWIFNRVNDNNKILIKPGSGESLNFKQGCIKYNIQGTGEYVTYVCSEYEIDIDLNPFDLVSIQIINDITFIKGSGACDNSNVVICGKEVMVPAAFLIFLNGKKKSAITQNIVTNTLTAASIYFSGAEILAAKGALSIATYAAYADLFVTFTDPYFSSPNFRSHASETAKTIFDINQEQADEIADVLQITWTIGLTVMTIDTAKKLPDPDEHVKALATYKALVNKVGEFDAKKMLSPDPVLANKTADGFKNVENDFIKQGRANELAEETKKAEDNINKFIGRNASFKLGKVTKSSKALIIENLPDPAGLFRQFALKVDDQVKNLRAANFAKKADESFNHYRDITGKYYIKHNPNTGEVLLIDVIDKKYLAYAIDEVYDSQKFIQNATENEFENLLAKWQTIKGLNEIDEILVSGKSIKFPKDKITLILGKYEILNNTNKYITTKAVLKELGLNHLKYWELSKDLLPSTQRIHMLNVPKNTYVKDTWWTSYNAQLIEDIAKDPSKYNVVILTNVANPNYTDELKVLGGAYEKEILELSKNFHFISKDDFWTIKTK
ncbi:fibronectin type III domain-containing protein [Cellulophaga sp. Hel_I_12]|uniref:fibronectin type III domain-containing protein n=1 Tax=Cellulophaga sp. Hel_I_12 TaxID=1249972 RepID=UPI000646B111|nr:fibronectin type III domain-containing protein [Cellulophaga sp. Hel_I_12]